MRSGRGCAGRSVRNASDCSWGRSLAPALWLAGSADPGGRVYWRLTRAEGSEAVLQLRCLRHFSAVRCDCDGQGWQADRAPCTVHRAPCGGGRAFGAWLLLHPWCDGCRCCGGVRAHVSGKSCLCCPGLPAARTGSVEARHRPVIGGDGERQLAAKSRTFR